MKVARIAIACAAVAACAAIVAVLVLAPPALTPQRADPWVSPTPSPTPTVRFTASGDFSSSPEALSVFSAIRAARPDLHLALGDLSYGTAGTEHEWCDAVTSRVGAGFPFELVSGNHESNGANGNIGAFTACLPNQLPGVIGTYGREYYVDVPASEPLVRFIMISPRLTFAEGDWSYDRGTPHYEWAAAAVDGAHSAGIPWVVVGMHKPCFSMGMYACDPGTDVTSMLVDRGVDLVLNGHEHLYQRTSQLAISPACPALVANAFLSECVADADDAMVKGSGTVFVTAGTGGMPFRDANTADQEAAYFVAYSALNANPTWGSLEVTVTATQLSASFARATGGTFTDAFILTVPS